MFRNICLKSLVIALTLVIGACAKSRSNAPARPVQQPAAPLVNANGAPVAPGGEQFDPYVALEGQGRWETIGDERYFVPDKQQLADEDGEEWAPYQRGYWNYDEEKSWTWVSHDSFGDVTDHYGIWRHHGRLGWIWLPFKDRRYEASTVTWFDDGDYVGWYPYFADYAQGYRHGQSFGFDDGYWDTFNVVLRLGTPGFNFRMGFTLVNRSQFSARNIRRVYQRDQSLIFRIAGIAHQPNRIREGRIGRYPGGHREGAYQFLQRYSTVQAPRGRAQHIRAENGMQMWQPYRAHGAPEFGRRYNNDRRDNGRPDFGGRRDDSNNRPGFGRRDDNNRPDNRPDVGRRENGRPDVGGRRDESTRPDFGRRDESTRPDFGRRDNGRPDFGGRRDDNRPTAPPVAPAQPPRREEPRRGEGRPNMQPQVVPPAASTGRPSPPPTAAPVRVAPPTPTRVEEPRKDSPAAGRPDMGGRPAGGDRGPRDRNVGAAPSEGRPSAPPAARGNEDEDKKRREGRRG